MMRNYKWILQQHPAEGVTYSPWTEIPANVRQLLEGRIRVQDHLDRVERTVDQGSADDLGNTIEPNPQGDGLHDSSHGAVAWLERDVTSREFSMGNPATSHRNLVFYELHGWIDERFADWQRAHGEEVDQTPLDPSHGGHHHTWAKKMDMPDINMSEAEQLVARFLSFPGPE